MENEVWKDIEGYEGLYQISNLGRVKNIKTNHILSKNLQNNGYLMAHLYKNGRKAVLIHRLVAKAFIPNPENKPTVNHKDHNRQNNVSSNLEWATMAEQHDEVMANLKIKKLGKKVLCVELNKIFLSTHEAEKWLNKKGHYNICRCCIGKTHYNTAFGYHWKYVE